MMLISVAIIMICSTPRNSVCIARNMQPTAVCENSSASAERTMDDVRNTTTPKPIAASPKTATKKACAYIREPPESVSRQ